NPFRNSSGYRDCVRFCNRHRDGRHSPPAAAVVAIEPGERRSYEKKNILESNRIDGSAAGITPRLVGEYSFQPRAAFRCRMAIAGGMEATQRSGRRKFDSR